MMQDFLNSLAGTTEQPPDPLETLVPKHEIGYRDFSKYYMGLLGVGSFSLVVTLAEIHPIFERLLVGMYLLLIVLLAMDMMNDHKTNGYLNKSRIYAYIGFYIVVGIALSFVIALVQNI